MATNLQLITPIWATNSETWGQKVDNINQLLWNERTTALTADELDDFRNEVYNELFNLIGKQIVHHNIITNNLSFFRRESMNYGDTIEEMMGDIVAQEAFNRGGSDDQFERTHEEIKAAYHKINREAMYRCTNEQIVDIRKAFRNESGLQQLIQSKANILTSSNEDDQLVYCKQMFQEYFNNTSFPVLPHQIISIENPLNNLLDVGLMMNLITAINGVIMDMTLEATRDYNPLGIKLQTRPEDLVVLVNSNLLLNREINLNSRLFHPNTEIDVPVKPFKNFGENAPAINKTWLALIGDKRTFNITPIMERFEQAKNVRNLYEVRYLHIHEMYWTSPFHNMCLLYGVNT